MGKTQTSWPCSSMGRLRSDMTACPHRKILVASRRVIEGTALPPWRIRDSPHPARSRFSAKHPRFVAQIRLRAQHTAGSLPDSGTNPAPCPARSRFSAANDGRVAQNRPCTGRGAGFEPSVPGQGTAQRPITARDSIAQQTITILEEYLGMRPAAKPAAPTVSHAPETSRPRLLYSIGNHQDGVDYVSRRTRIFEEIAQLPPIPITDTAPRTDVILAQIREEEAR